MPAFLAIPGIIPALIGAGAAGTTAGLSLADVGTGSPQKTADQQLQIQQQQLAQQAQQQQQKLIGANLANSQEQSGGNVNNQTLVDLASIISGVPGSAGTTTGNNALAAFLGTPNSSSSTTDNLVSSTYGINGGQG